MEESFTTYERALRHMMQGDDDPERFQPDDGDYVWRKDCKSYKDLITTYRSK